MRLNRTRIVLCEHLVEYGCDVHCVGVQSTCSLMRNDDAPRGSAMLISRFRANDAPSASTYDPNLDPDTMHRHLVVSWIPSPSLALWSEYL
jgi:hypothetical protein